MSLKIPFQGGAVPAVITGPDGSATAPTYSFTDDTNTGVYSVINDAVSIACGGNEVGRFQPAGSGVSLVSQPVTLGNAGNISRLIQNGASGGAAELTSVAALVTLNTGGTTTDTASIIPANAIVIALTYRVTTAITTAASFSIGDATTADRFVSGATGLTLGSTGVGLRHMQGGVSTDAAGPVYTSASVVRITTNANPGAGAIRVQVWYRIFTPPTS